MIYSPRAFFLLGTGLLGLQSMDDRVFRAHFGCCPEVCSILWQRISRERTDGKAMPYHLLWTLNFLKAYDSEDVLATRFGTTRNTIRKWIWTILRKICRLKRRVVSIEFSWSCFLSYILTRDIYSTDHLGKPKEAWRVQQSLVHGLCRWN